MKFTTSASAFASVALAAASFVSASPAESATSLEARTFGTNEFWWKGGNCALTKGGPPKIEAKPKDWDIKGLSCPTGKWSYSSKWGCCIPHVEVEAVKESPSCATNNIWDHSSKCCKKNVPRSEPACKANEFEFTFGSAKFCLPKGGNKNPPAPPAGKDCKTHNGGWKWHAGNGCCVPDQPNPPAPTCVNGKWSDSNKCCKITPPPSPPKTPTPPPKTPTPPPKTPTPPPKTACKANEFEWTLFGGKKVCLPHGGEHNPPSPPKGKDCSTHTGGRNWSNVHGCCVPKTPDVPKVPVCVNGKWSDSNRCCHVTPPPPAPPVASGRPKRRSHKTIRAVLPLDGRIDEARCPKQLTACPVAQQGEYECLDPLVELTSCGGCASIGKGENCLLIKDSASVTCQIGQCQVLSCRAGFAPSMDGKKCVNVLSL